MRIVFILTWFFVNQWIIAQTPQYGFLPAITASYKISDQWQLAAKVESDHVTSFNTLGELIETHHYVDEVNFQLYAAAKINPYWRFAGGYQLGYQQEGAPTHQSILQFSNTIILKKGRLGQRFRSDQGFYENKLNAIRIRYRLSYEFPLNGTTLDPKEMYLLVKNEPLIQFFKELNRFENRLSTVGGYYLNKRNKLELGLEHRFSRFYQKEYSSNRYFLKLDWIVRI